MVFEHENGLCLRKGVLGGWKWADEGGKRVVARKQCRKRGLQLLSGSESTCKKF